MNWRGFYTLFAKEVWRFMKVAVQTVLTPVVTAVLYLVVFAHVLEEHVQVYPGVSYTAFLIPGLIMMSVIQNAFANSSSSLIQSKMNGNIVFVLLAPISSLEFYAAFVLAAIARGVMVGVVLYVIALGFADLPVQHVGILLAFAVLGSGLLGALGLIGGIWADKYDQLAAYQNFLILPLSFLSGVFYSLYSLSPFWQWVSRFNPFFYMIDGVRYGFLGVSDVPPLQSLWVISLFFIVISLIALGLIQRGYKLRR
ncbi:MAG: ABC transporter permease [Gammaproteobacteria bacterium]|nr:ABC transporter permease [Gammaproteobacteria bacterium]